MDVATTINLSMISLGIMALLGVPYMTTIFICITIVAHVMHILIN